MTKLLSIPSSSILPYLISVNIDNEKKKFIKQLTDSKYLATNNQFILIYFYLLVRLMTF